MSVQHPAAERIPAEGAKAAERIPAEGAKRVPAESAERVPAGAHRLESHRGLRVAGRWYYVVTIVTVGMFAWVPFAHAATRLRTRPARLLALAYAILDVLLYVLISLTPRTQPGHTSVLGTIGGLLAVGVAIVGCVQLGPLRRQIWEGAPAPDEPVLDPAVQAALAARTRREESRRIVADDPLLAHELHIGRPDITRGYDDGGLVDLNSAPAQVIGSVCDIPPTIALSIVDTRNRRGDPFANVDELLVLADIPVGVWDRIRDRAVLLSQ